MVWPWTGSKTWPAPFPRQGVPHCSPAWTSPLWDEGFTRLEEYADDEQVVAAVDTALRRVLELKAMFGLLPEDGADTAAIAMPSADAIAQATADGREAGQAHGPRGDNAD